MENKVKHLEFIQDCINRMAHNSFMLKGWSITIIAALFALATKDSNPEYIIIAYLPVVIFFVLDGYYLYKERLFIALYDHVRMLNENDVDFSMDTRPFQLKTWRHCWRAGILSIVNFFFYIPLVIVILIVKSYFY